MCNRKYWANKHFCQKYNTQTIQRFMSIVMQTIVNNNRRVELDVSE